MKTAITSDITQLLHIVPSNMKMMIISIWICSSVFLLGHALYIEQPEPFKKSNGNLPVRKTRSIQTTNLTNFYNVIAQDGADPWVYKHTDGYYYMTRTTGGDVRIWRSRTFTSFDASYSMSIWSSSGSGPACSGVWAPEIHYLNSSWYVYFAATTCDGNNYNHRMFVLENTNADPFTGSFTFKGQITDVTNYWAIDGTVYQDRSGQLYFIWSGWQGITSSPQSLYIAQMSNPWTVSSGRVLISTPTYPWEQVGLGINEGPEVTVHNKVISLVYSASGSWTNNYCLGLLTASTKSNLLNASSWTKHPSPIFNSTNKVFGPGHHSLTKSPDGKEDWIVYHSARYSGGGWNRQIRTQKFTWNADSTPNLGTPADPNIPIQIPSGDSTRDRYEAEDAYLLNDPSIVIDSTASNNMQVVNIDNANSTIISTIWCAKAGSYVIAIRNCNGSPSYTTATQLVSVNNGTLIEYPVMYGGWSSWGVLMFASNLQQGANTLTFMKGKNSFEVDEIDVSLALQ